LYKPDFNSDFDQILLEQPFTFVGLSLFESFNRMIVKGITDYNQIETGAVGKLSRNMAEELSLMIGPSRNTILHVTSRSLDLTRFINRTIQEGRNIQEGREEKFPIPFLENLLGDTPLHESLSDSFGDQATAEYYLKELLVDMPFDHHGRAICDIIHKCIERAPIITSSYIDNRFMSTK